MNENIAQGILQELFSSLEARETESTGVLQFTMVATMPVDRRASMMRWHREPWEVTVR
jgi:hypothetical protein